MTQRETRWRRVGTSFGVVALCLYAPFAWLLLTGDSGTGHHRYWLTLWPILPGFVPAFLPGPLLYGRHLPYEFEAMGATAVALLLGLTWLGAAAGRRLAAAAGVALLVAVPTAGIAYAVYRA